jgi:ABC-type polar amino acid transport system ATPase subunit
MLNLRTKIALEPAVAATGTPVLQLRQVSKRFGDVVALDEVSLEVQQGEALVVIGPSGSGKSTLVRCIQQLEELESGAIYIDGELLGYRWRNGRLHHLRERALARQRQRTGMVFQQFNLFPHWTVLENVSRPLAIVRGEPLPSGQSKALKLLERVGLSGKADSYPSQLSGGQRQRVAIVRALAMEPRVMLFDEATSALDPELVGEVLAVMRQLAEDGLTMIIVTHELQFAHDVGDRCVFMDQGRVVEIGDARKLLDDPQTERLQAFLARHRAR